MKRHLAASTILLFMIAAFALSPIPGGNDWEIMSAASRSVLTDGPLYGREFCGPLAHGYFYNPPWVAVLLLPIALLPFRLGWAVLSVASLIVALCVLRHWQPAPGLIKPILTLLSPPMIYIILHGQIDVLILGGIFLPATFWPLVALAKPQVAIGLVFGAPRPRWVRAVLITALILVLSMVTLGPWPLELFQQAPPEAGNGLATHSLWLSLWPYNAPLGVLFLAQGLSRKDERLLLAASPFLAPYAPTSAFIGAWIAACALLKDWQAVLVFLAWWGAVGYRAML